MASLITLYVMECENTDLRLLLFLLLLLLLLPPPPPPPPLLPPPLQGDLRAAALKLAETEQELNSLSMDFLKKTANHFREFFLRSLSSAIQGRQ